MAQKNINECDQKGYCSWLFNSQYLKKLRLENTFTDDELISFWKKQIDIVIKKTSDFDRTYHAYKAGDMQIDALCSYVKKFILNWEKFIMNVIIVVFQCHLVNIRNFAIEV